jgi:hypothetical protein
MLVRVRLGIWILVALGLVALAGGCGGGSSSSSAPSSTTAAPLTKAAFLKQGNALCRSAEKRRGKIIEAAVKKAPEGTKFSTAEQEKLVLAALVPYEPLAEELGKLPPPRQDEAQVEEFLSALEKSVERTRKEPASGISGVAFRKMDGLAIAYGLKDCSV